MDTTGAAIVWAHQQLEEVRTQLGEPTAGTVVLTLLALAADHHDYGEEDRARALLGLALSIATDWRAHHLAGQN